LFRFFNHLQPHTATLNAAKKQMAFPEEVEKVQLERATNHGAEVLTHALTYQCVSATWFGLLVEVQLTPFIVH